MLLVDVVVCLEHDFLSKKHLDKIFPKFAQPRGGLGTANL